MVLFIIGEYSGQLVLLRSSLAGFELRLVEIANPGTEIFSWCKFLKHAWIIAFTTSRDHVVPPPVQLYLVPLKGEEDDDGCHSNGAAK
jgi:hypothetical protein